MADKKLMDKSNKQYQLPQVSVIVPVYNVEKYLYNCLNSLEVQTLKNIEIIVIDDGSLDQSVQISDAFAAKDSRFRVFHKKNEGLAAARNEGLKLARSKYIMFVDSDDWVEQDFCETPYLVAEKNEADLVVFQYSRCNSKVVNRREPFPKEGIMPKEKVLTTYWHFASVVVWNKLYRRELFKGICYPVGHLCEDVAITYRVIYNAKRVYLLNRYLYYYYVSRPNSITDNKNIRLFDDLTMYQFRRLDDLKRWGYSCKDEEKQLALTYLITKGRHAELSARCENSIRKSRNTKYINTWKLKIMFWVYKVSPFLFDFISIIAGKRI